LITDERTLRLASLNGKLAEDEHVKYTNILMGTDGTALMDAVFDECAYLARLMGAMIHVAYVLDVTGFGAQPIDATWEERYVIIKSEARQILNVAREALVKRGVAEASITEILLEGHPTEEISAYVNDHEIDLIVIGTHGRKGLDRLLIGSLTDKIIRTATVPVLVVHWM
jgi:nucleotide-binding universal stress UspA family protein